MKQASSAQPGEVRATMKWVTGRRMGEGGRWEGAQVGRKTRRLETGCAMGRATSLTLRRL